MHDVHATLPALFAAADKAARKKLTRKEKKRLKPPQRQRKEAKLKQRATEDFSHAPGALKRHFETERDLYDRGLRAAREHPGPAAGGAAHDSAKPFWLETHVWQSKRMNMEERWGYGASAPLLRSAVQQAGCPASARRGGGLRLPHAGGGGPGGDGLG